LTQSAAERIRSFLDRDGGVGLRLGVKKTGCSGWAYTVELADEILADDVVFEQEAVKVVVTSGSLAFLDGSVIDFVAEGLGSSFQFRFCGGRAGIFLSVQQSERNRRMWLRREFHHRLIPAIIRRLRYGHGPQRYPCFTSGHNMFSGPSGSERTGSCHAGTLPFPDRGK
jgi:iron-sulfur cluster assembly protein